MDTHLEAQYEDLNGDPFGFCFNSDGEFDPDDTDDDCEDCGEDMDDCVCEEDDDLWD